MVHLHIRSSFSLLKSTIRINELVSYAKSMNMDSLALTDLNVMHGSMAFKRACEIQGIHPIFGLECRCEIENYEYSFIVLAKDDVGYQNCMKLSSRLCTVNEKLTLQELSSCTHHCFVIASQDHSKLDEFIIEEDNTQLESTLKLFHESFEDFVCGIVMNDTGLLRIKNPNLKQIAKANGIKTVALSRVYMLKKEDEEAFRVLSAIDQGLKVSDKTLDVASGRYLRSEMEMSKLYDSDDLEMSDIIARSCQVAFAFEKSEMPKYQNQYGVSSYEFLKSLCIKGLQKRRGTKQIEPIYVERLKYELDMIHKMHFDDYFLIVYDFIKFARSKKIYVGPGRGSAPGSLVAYCLGITHIDPIKYKLLFERFLNPERISMPDIDTDFPDDRRDEVIDYVRRKYGDEHVAHIVTFGTLAAKQVLRDVAKTLGISSYDVDILTKSIPYMLENKKVTLSIAYSDVERFRTAVNAKAENRRLFEIALKLEGLPRHVSTHAAGVVLSGIPIVNVCPLISSDDALSSTQFTMEHLESLGLIKMDFLAIRNLTIIDEIANQIRISQPDFDIMKIPLNDRRTFELIKAVDTTGIFQLESEGMRNVVRQMKPECFEDIATLLALFRPGPMDNIPKYLENRTHPQKINYLHKDLKPILEETYGIIVYQEQSMQIAQKMAGFSLGKADILRKAMSKKKLKELEYLKKDFIEGAVRLHYDEKLANDVYELILKFANYGFNKSHSVAYGMVVYQMSYLKANYPLFFYISLLNSVIGSDTKTSEYIFEAKKRHITILPPNINFSEKRYVVSGSKIIYPLIGIRNVGINGYEKIVKERERGIFLNYHDCVARLSKAGINRKTLESCIMAGAFDCFKRTRASMLASLEDSLRYASIILIEDDDQMSLDYSLATPPPMIQIADQPLKKANQEKEVLGFYLSEHPLSRIKQQMNFQGRQIIECLQPCGSVEMMGTLAHIKPHKTKRGDLMCFAVLSDETASIDLVIMPSLYRSLSQVLKKGSTYRVNGKVDKENSCLVNRMEEVQLES